MGGGQFQTCRGAIPRADAFKAGGEIEGLAAGLPSFRLRSRDFRGRLSFWPEVQSPLRFGAPSDLWQQPFEEPAQ